MFVKLTNGQPSKYPYTLGELRRDNPQTSFPRVIPAETLAQYGVHPVKETVAPKIDTKTHRQSQGVALVNGFWTQVWTAIQLSQGEAAINVRVHRDRLLAETDWIVIKAQEAGSLVSPEWAAYRQALRDITNHVNFPHLAEEDWPVKP